MGTVKGDLHDIGKNLCIMMLRGAGFIVHDLGVDTKPDEFIDAVMEHEAQILGMSALLTTTMPNMGRTIEAFEEYGLRDTVRIMVGGAPVRLEFADDMGADGYGENAMECVDMAKRFMGAGEAGRWHEDSRVGTHVAVRLGRMAIIKPTRIVMCATDKAYGNTREDESVASEEKRALFDKR
ncbi:Dimethylamine corrinoid protein 3 [Geodia barretti]|nr:Dimethylamine corrinoid protein 3 [Geodia barretti]